MNFRISLVIIFIGLGLSLRAAVEFTGFSHEIYRADVASSSGLSAVYVAREVDGGKIVYRASSLGASVEVSRFENSGVGYSTPVAVTCNGNEYVFDAPVSDCGFTVTENGRQTSFYFINYDNHRAHLRDLTHNSEESDCAMIALNFVGEAGEISYYTVTGRRMGLSREMKLKYSTLVYDEGSESYIGSEAVESIGAAGLLLRVPQPLCATSFTLTADRFLEFWNEAVEVESPVVEPHAVDARTSAVQEDRDVDNEQKVDANLGGSAPVDVTFKAAVTDAAVFHEWQFSSSPDFDIIDLRFTDLEFVYTFRDAGKTYVRFMAANSGADCDYISDIYEVFIGESRIDCPNAFSPGSTPGINDEWKVSYKSIVSFECHIFNRWGIEVAHFNDPSQGWDGRYKGKIVPSGVYYYVIKAKGADGHDYNLSGDINILKSTVNRTTDSDNP